MDGVVGPLTSAALRNQTATTATLQSFHNALPGEAPSTNTPSTAAAELQKLGGARVILATAPNSKAATSPRGGLALPSKPRALGYSAQALLTEP